MNINFRCSKCKRVLKVDTLSAPNLQDIIYEITPCDNKNCYNCSDCEEMIKSVKAEEAAEEIENKMLDIFTEFSTTILGIIERLKNPVQILKPNKDILDKDAKSICIERIGCTCTKCVTMNYTCIDCKNIECLKMGRIGEACEKIKL